MCWKWHQMSALAERSGRGEVKPSLFRAVMKTDARALTQGARGKPQLLEPPGADPHAGWCGRGERATAPPIPIHPSVASILFSALGYFFSPSCAAGTLAAARPLQSRRLKVTRLNIRPQFALSFSLCSACRAQSTHGHRARTLTRFALIWCATRGPSTPKAARQHRLQADGLCRHATPPPVQGMIYASNHPGRREFQSHH